MGDTIRVASADISVKEWGGERVVTFKDIDAAHGRPEGTAMRNFNTNKEHFVLGEDYFVVSSDEIRRNGLFPISESDHRDKALITESGYLMLVKSLTDEKAWEVQRKLVKFYFRGKMATAELSPQMQILYGMLDHMAQMERDTKEAKETAERAIEATDNIKHNILAPLGDWRRDVNDRIREIAKETNVAYQTLFDEMYGVLECRAHCNLKQLRENKIARMEKAGNTKTCIKNETTKLAIIEDNARLKEIFGGIVREYAAKYL